MRVAHSGSLRPVCASTSATDTEKKNENYCPIDRLDAEQVESMLKTQDVPAPGAESASASASASARARNLNVPTDPDMAIASGAQDTDRWLFHSEASPQNNSATDDFDFNTNNMALAMAMPNLGTDFTWEMIGLGLEEPLPPQHIIEELYDARPPHVDACLQRG